MKVSLKKDRTTVGITIPDEDVIDVLYGQPAPAIHHKEIHRVISDGIRTHCPESIGDRKIAVIIPDDTRLWARGDLFVPPILKALFDLGVEPFRVRIIIALGTHHAMDKEKFSQLAGAFSVEQVEILNSANADQNRLVQIGETRRKTQLYFTREAVEADHIIIFGGILHHLIAGFGGGRKYIAPGVAGYDTIQQNHALTIRTDGTPHPLVQPGQLEGNPVHEDVTEAADLFLQGKTCTYVAVAANGEGEIFHCAVGPLHETFIDGCEKLDQVCCQKVPFAGDFALISAGGHRTDGQLYQATKALFNAVNVVKEGGDILFVAGCAQGVGNDTFAETMRRYGHDPSTLGRHLADRFNMPSYVAFRLIDVLSRYRVTLVSDLRDNDVRQMGLVPLGDVDAYIKQLNGRGFVMPYAENVLPAVDAAAHPGTGVK